MTCLRLREASTFIWVALFGRLGRNRAGLLGEGEVGVAAAVGFRCRFERGVALALRQRVARREQRDEK